ncbi:class I SAM-dependent methyltransferase [Halocatena salina]|uniref:Class I SAM-dependent methyltransferase n=1 Tax=Halocatena salina TaxID=2934340 RepID=A0A8T9ZZ23_9EURY|nr:class I SAM-dependent methyltransferase [Halocatena salina]UPM42011.1 class I SAM-dependent methyltransferase [Halocatena salina]
MVHPNRTDPETYYDEYGEQEWERLDRDFFHRLEWEGTVEQLDTYLPSSQPNHSPHVLDVGGGAGRYSIWLARKGYTVTLVDPSETQRELAREKIEKHGVDDRVTVHAGDVRDLDFEDETFAATCCLGGPISHVLDGAERLRAATELRRVTTSDGPVFVSVMGLIGMVMITVQYAGRGTADGDDLSVMPDLVRERDYTAALAQRHDMDPALFDCHFFRRDELVDLLSNAGLAVETVVALEGVAGLRRTHFEALDEPARDTIRELNDLLRTDSSLVDVSPHMLAVCWA